MTATEAWGIISACDLTDSGPYDEGWQSLELMDAIEIVKTACMVYDHIINRRNI